MLDRIFLQVLNMSFTGSYVILFILLARLPLQKAPKLFSYGLWSAALFRLICPWSFESALSLLAIGGRTTEQLRPFPLVPFSQGQITLEAAGNGIGSTGNTTVSPVISTGAPEPLMENIFTLFWLIGIAALLTYSLASLFRLRKRLKGALCGEDGVYLSEHLSTPFVMGLLHPKIYLPESLSGMEKEYILLHERTHIRRYDHVIKLISFFVLCLHWFNPLVWLAFLLSGRDMEMSCDEAVIKKLGNGVKKEYTTSLLSLSTGRRIVGGTPLAFGEGEAKGRIKNVLSYQKPAFWAAAAGLIAVIAVCLGLAADPKSPGGPAGYAEKLWQYRTAYVGDNSAVGNMIGALAFPDGVAYENFELHTKEPPYGVTINLSTDTETRNYYTGASHEAPFQLNACILFSLIENTEYITFSLDDGIYDPYSIQYTSDWARSIAEADPWEESETLEEFENLLVNVNGRVNAGPASAQKETPPAQQAGLTFWVKPDEPPQVIGETAAKVWLNSYMEDVPPVNRLADYKINKVTVISGTPKKGQTYAEMNYHYVVRLNYDITTASEEYLAAGDGISGKGTFKDLFRELCVKDLSGGNFEIVSAGTGGGEQEFADPLEEAVSKAILERDRSAGQDSGFICESHVTLAAKAGEPAENGGSETLTVYAIVLIQKFNYSGSGLTETGGSHIPAAITFEVTEPGLYTLKEYWVPRDGSYYGPDIKEKFPREIWEDAFDTQKYILAQIQSCYAQAVEYKKLDTLPIIEKLFETIMSSPAHSSRPGDYLDAHKLDYRELTYYGDYTLRYVFAEFLKGGQTGLKGQIMRAVMDDLLGAEAVEINADDGQAYFNAWREEVRRRLTSMGMEAVRHGYPKSYLLLTMLPGED